MKKLALLALPIWVAIAVIVIAYFGNEQAYLWLSAPAAASYLHGWVLGAAMLFAGACYLQVAKKTPAHFRVSICAWVVGLSVYPLFWSYLLKTLIHRIDPLWAFWRHTEFEMNWNKTQDILDQNLIVPYYIAMLILTAALLLAVLSDLGVQWATAICRRLRLPVRPTPAPASTRTT